MKQNKHRLLSVFAVLLMVCSVFAAIPLVSSEDAEAAASTWTYTIAISGNTSSTAVSISGVTDKNGNSTTNLTSSSVGSWGWDSKSEYGPFGSYYAAFDSSGQIKYHVRADDLKSKVGTNKGSNNVDSNYNIMWVLPTVYWKVSGSNLVLTNDSTAGGTAYAHTIDGKVYSYLAIGVYETQIKDNKAMSLSGVSPTASTTRPNFRTASEYSIDTNGSTSGGSGYAMQWNYYQWALYKYCVFATLGTFNSQSFAGGPVNNSAASTTGGANTSGSSMPQGYYTSGSSNQTDSVRLFLENAWGSVYEFVDNTYVNNRVWYVGQTHNASDNSTSKTNIGTMPSSSNYFDTILTSANNWGMPSATKTGSNSSGLYDYYYQNSGERSVYVGGGWSYTSNAGVSFVIAGYSLSCSDSIVGSRLSFVFDADPAAIQSYTITYNANGGSVSPTSVTVEDGTSVSLPTPTKTYWVFTGWYDGNTRVGGAGSSYTVTATKTLVAHWTEQTVNLVFYYNLPSPTGGSNVYTTVAVNINTAPSSSMPADPTQYGLEFAGWYNEAATTTGFDPTVALSADKGVYAKWNNTLRITSVPSISCISHNTYSFSVELEAGQTAVWFDEADEEIGTGASIEHTFATSGVHTGHVVIYDSDDSVYDDIEWSTEVLTTGTEDNNLSIISVVVVAMAILAIGFFALRRL